MSPTRKQSAEAFLRSFRIPVRDIALETRNTLLRNFPDAVEEVKEGWKVVWFGTSSKMSDQIFAIAPQKDWVNLGFLRGAELPDPDELLEGTGKRVRHVKVRDTRVLRSRALTKLIAAAIERARAGAKNA